MATLAYPFEVRDSTNTTTDNRKTGLTIGGGTGIAVSAGKTIAASPATVSAGTVTIVEIAGGHYAALYDPEATGDASFPLDMGSGSGLTNPNDRYITLDLTRDAGRILAGFSASGQVTPTPQESILQRTGTAQAGGTSTITLDSSASSSDGSYVGHTITIITGTGATASRQIVGYVGTTKVATVHKPWNTTPDATSVFQILKAIGPALDASNGANLSLTQAIPATGNTANTVADALNAARAQGFGPWTLNATAKTLTLYAADGTTPIRVFNLDSATSPLTRS